MIWRIAPCRSSLMGGLGWTEHGTLTASGTNGSPFCARIESIDGLVSVNVFTRFRSTLRVGPFPNLPLDGNCRGATSYLASPGSPPAAVQCNSSGPLVERSPAVGARLHHP